MAFDANGWHASSLPSAWGDLGVRERSEEGFGSGEVVKVLPSPPPVPCKFLALAGDDAPALFSRRPLGDDAQQAITD
jgi:hypothetical protein